MEQRGTYNEQILSEIEKNITSILKSFVTHGIANINVINMHSWENCHLTTNANLGICYDRCIKQRQIKYSNIRSKHNFGVVVYAMAIIHCTILKGENNTFRELFYRNKILTQHQRHICSAIHIMCSKLRHVPWDLNIVASGKGLVAGALKIKMTNGDVVDCQSFKGATLLPNNFALIETLETNAKFVLLVEKDTVFEKLLMNNIFEIIGDDVIILTGRGFPDMCTRIFINRIYKNFSIPIYFIGDADPFGIEIFFVYRYGSRSLAYCVEHLACSSIKWLGVHPSEISTMNLTSSPFSKTDAKKVVTLISRFYISSAERAELQVLSQLQKKASIESIPIHTLLCDYFPNKIRRNLVI